MSLLESMFEACREVGIVPPASALSRPGVWIQTPVEGKARTNKSGRVCVFEDGAGGIVWNWATGASKVFRADGAEGASVNRPWRPSQKVGDHAEEAAQLAARIVKTSTPAAHPYLAAKGFPDERGLVIDNLHRLVPAGKYGEAVARQIDKIAEPGKPLLVVPGWIGRKVSTVQLIDADGKKLNLLGGKIGGACHRVSTGRETWIAEGIATALTIRAALKRLGRSATVLAAFSAMNVAKVARNIQGAIIAADNDRPIEHLNGLGTGEYHARASGRRWIMPPEPGDWNDYHQAHGLRAVSSTIKREVPP
ncbi:MAG: hypothetical protein D6773_18500 [Alphaproteobacteria bacterium]|nr:MAG: hypothetical protein D6773_18500 [Alphaproteobacteria bacterium]